MELILNEQHGYRIAVILNEIGDERGIEKALLQDEEGALPASLRHAQLKCAPAVGQVHGTPSIRSTCVL